MTLIANIVDVGLGNIRSVEHWLNRCNLASQRVSIANQFSVSSFFRADPGQALSQCAKLHELELDH